MSKYKVIKQVSFGSYTIKDKDGYDAQLQDYAPKIGDIIEGEPTSGTLIGVAVLGIPFEIKTNGDQSTTGQISIQTIPLDYLEVYVEPVNDEPPGPNNPNTPTGMPGTMQIGTRVTIIVIVVIVVAAVITLGILKYKKIL